MYRTAELEDAHGAGDEGQQEEDALQGVLGAEAVLENVVAALQGTEAQRWQGQQDVAQSAVVDGVNGIGEAQGAGSERIEEGEPVVSAAVAAAAPGSISSSGGGSSGGGGGGGSEEWIDLGGPHGVDGDDGIIDLGELGRQRRCCVRRMWMSAGPLHVLMGCGMLS